MTVKSCEKLEKSRVALTIEVGAEEFEAAVNKAYLKMRGKMNIPGFRPGKAPRKMIESMYGAEVFYEEAVNAILPDAYESAVDEQKLEARILRDIGESPNRDVEKLLCGLVPHSMAPVLSRRLGLPPTLKANSLTREQRRALIRMLKHFEINVTGVRPVAEAIVTAGGVKVSEVKPNTMESKLVEGLYFAGEVLDVDAYTGGFNLQIAWATGHLAGVSAAERE